MNWEIQRRPMEFRPELLPPPEPYSGMMQIAARGAFSQMVHGVVRRQFRAGGVAQEVGQADERPLVVGAGPGSHFAGRVHRVPDRARRRVEQVRLLPGEQGLGFGPIAGVVERLTQQTGGDARRTLDAGVVAGVLGRPVERAFGRVPGAGVHHVEVVLGDGAERGVSGGLVAARVGDGGPGNVVVVDVVGPVGPVRLDEPVQQRGDLGLVGAVASGRWRPRSLRSARSPARSRGRRRSGRP